MAIDLNGDGVCIVRVCRLWYKDSHNVVTDAVSDSSARQTPQNVLMPALADYLKIIMSV
jgi:hypothetical protein